MPTAPITKRVWLADELRSEMLSLGAQAYPNEVGGILAGYRNGGDVVVSALVGPGPAATSSRTSFTPDGAFHADEMARIYAESHGCSDYLGDWHTHPDGAPVMSALDLHTLRAIARAKQARCDLPLMLIAAGCGEAWQLAAFALEPKRWLIRRAAAPVPLLPFRR